MQLCGTNLLFPCSLAAQHVSSDVIAHNQEHLNCSYSFWFYSHVSLLAGQPTTTHVNKTRSCNYSLDDPDDER